MNRILFVGCILFLGFAGKLPAQKPGNQLQPEALDYLETEFQRVTPCNGVTAASYRILGRTDKGKQEIWYLWVYIGCFVRNQEQQDIKRAISLPVRMEVEFSDDTLQVISCRFPGEGADYSKDVRRLFPPDVQEYIFHLAQHRAEIEALQRQATQRATKLMHQNEPPNLTPVGRYRGICGSMPIDIRIERSGDSIRIWFVKELTWANARKDVKPFTGTVDEQGIFHTEQNEWAFYSGTLNGRITDSLVTATWIRGDRKVDFKLRPLESPDTTGWKPAVIPGSNLTAHIPADWNAGISQDVLQAFSRPFGLELYPWQKDRKPDHLLIRFDKSRLDVWSAPQGTPCSAFISLPEKNDMVLIFNKQLGNHNCRVMVAEEGAAGTLHKNIIYVIPATEANPCLVFDLNYSVRNSGAYGDPYTEPDIPVYDENEVIRKLEKIIGLLGIKTAK